MRTLLLLLVIAFGTDALMFSGAYSQAAWRKLSQYTVELRRNVETPAPAPAPTPPATVPDNRPSPG